MNAKNKTTFILFFIFLGLKLSYSQIIKGTVFDNNEKPLTAKILIKTPNNITSISEFVLVNNGNFSYKLKKKYNTSGLLLEVTATGYNSYEKIFKPSELKENLSFKFILLKEKVEKLEEVVIKSKKKFTVKEDTVAYKVEAYKDGTERKVEDLLKKLPGIEVNDSNGIIKYKGKAIETVTIEGDNLFDYNYSIGTKNINIDLVKEIEAIENYSENKLLKGIENSNKVALNLKLKENKTDFSLSTDLGIGDFPDSKNTPLDVSANLLGINKKQKSFAIVAYNNIGKNASPFDYFGNQLNFEQIKEKKYLVEKIIPELNLPQVANTNLTNINNQFFGNLNSIYSFSDKTKAKLNLYSISDKIESNQFSESIINTNNQTFTIFDNRFIQKRPTKHRGDFELKFNTSKSSLLKYNISLRDEYIENKKTIFSNQSNDFLSFSKFNSIFFKQNIEYTKKITNKKVLQLNLVNTTNNIAHNLDIEPSIFNKDKYNKDSQNINSKKSFTTFKAHLLGKKNKNKYTISIGVNLSNQLLNSELFSKNNKQISPIENSLNNLSYTKNEIYNLVSYNWRIGKFTISPNYSLKYLYQNLKQNNTLLNSETIVFEPSLDVSYKIDRTSILSLKSGLNKEPSSIKHLFSNQILMDNRIVKNNFPNILLQKNQAFNLFYSKNDLFNQFQLYIGANYIKQKGNFFNKIFIDKNSTKITNFFLLKNTEDIAFNLNISKLIPTLRTNFKITSNYSIYNFKNIVNNSELRSNKSIFSTNSIFLKTAFHLPVNLENETTYTLQKNMTSANIFSNKSIENNLKLIFKPSKEISGSLSYNYFIPSFKNKANNYSFFSSSIFFRPKNKNWQFNLSGVNLLNEQFYTQKNTSDISSDTFRSNLLGRHFLFSFSYSF
uniref:hypothetical protein n=1 Tax=uncultured Tenacibaculum sp. TaxID=174713 RepID=UPI002604CFED|nr:hypothetical protein [uncultured Tenacibaculum sp.]